MNIEINQKTKTIDIWGTDKFSRNAYTQDSPYYFSFESFNTLKKLSDWVTHMEEKNWWTPELAKELIQAYRVVNNRPQNSKESEELDNIYKETIKKL